MTKEEILEKSRKENKNKDICEIEAINQSSATAIRIGLLLCCLISTIEVVFTDTIHCGTWTVFFGMTGTLFLIKYIKLRKKHELVLSIFYILLGTGFLVTYILNLLGVI
ncbi:MAG: hypothetical protein K2F81_03150 [Ruminococcus sp.]|nr:hypothetical protein [Ruminococcus sp.]